MYRILVVEDDAGIAQAICKQAAMWDLQAEYVRDFRDAMSTFAQYQPHLVLLDISLPFYNELVYNIFSSCPNLFAMLKSEKAYIIQSIWHFL